MGIALASSASRVRRRGDRTAVLLRVAAAAFVVTACLHAPQRASADDDHDASVFPNEEDSDADGAKP